MWFFRKRRTIRTANSVLVDLCEQHKQRKKRMRFTHTTGEKINGYVEDIEHVAPDMVEVTFRV